MAKKISSVIKDIQIGYTTIKDFDIVGITSYKEDDKGLNVKYYDGREVKINGSTSAINVLKVICDTSITNFNEGAKDAIGWYN